MIDPIVCLDFDGVLHKYTSGWQGARRISDPPVDGAMAWIIKAVDHFDVRILSSRSHQWGGRRAMKRWLRRNLAQWFHERPLLALRHADNPMETDDWKLAFDAADGVLAQIGFPRHKPPAHVTIDDRAWHFDGSFPAIEDVANFSPWNRTPGNNPPHEKAEPSPE